jgi:putative ABC transport system ATP-binding protein
MTFFPSFGWSSIWLVHANGGTLCNIVASGRTTLINLLSCLDQADEGSLRIDDREVIGLPESDLVNIRRGTLGFVFQNFHLLPTLTVAENVELPLLFLPRPMERAETMRVLE